VVQECGAGLVTVRRTGNGLAFAAPPLLREGPVDDDLQQHIAGVLRIDRAAIRDALAETRGFPGVTGTVTFNAERNALKPIVIIRIGDNGRQSVEAHVTPEDLAPTPTPTPSPTPRRKGKRQK
jgi:hypothetical protein